MENYYSNNILNIKRKVILFRIETILEFLRKTNPTAYRFDVKDYVKEHKKELEAVKTPEKFLINYHVSSINMLSNLDIEICDDVNLTIAMMLKTTSKLYVPSAPIRYDDDKIVNYLMFDKDEYFANSR